jgi:hypothetical protein
MPTNYPTSLDNFTNPTANDSLNLPSHSTQHANANDAIEAIEAKLGVGNADKVGRYLVSSSTFSSTAQLIVDNCFSAAYDNYEIIFFVTSKGTTGQLSLQLRSGGSTIGGVAYRQQSQRSYGTTIDSYPYSSGTSLFLTPAAVGNGQPAYWSMNFYNPFVATTTFWDGKWFAYDGVNFVGNVSEGAEYTSAARDGFTIYGTGTISGYVAIYGYRTSTA